MIVDFQHHFTPRELIKEDPGDRLILHYDESGAPSYTVHRLLYDLDEHVVTDIRALGPTGEQILSGNVGLQGIEFPPKILARSLAEALRKTRIYRPDPMGRWEARQAVSRFYLEDGVTIPPEQILLTPGTSVSYWYAFKVLANSGGGTVNVTEDDNR